MIRTLLLLVLFVGGAQAACPPVPTPPSAAQATAWAAQAPDRGMLWRISRGGHSSYLFGTLHVGRADWAYPGPALRAAWAQTEVLAVELDPADFATALPSLPKATPLPPTLARRMEALMAAACLSPAALSPYPVMLQLSTLMLMEARRDGFDAGFGQDLMLLARAKAQGRPVQSLETLEAQLAALEPTQEEMPVVVASSLQHLQDGAMRAPLRKLADAWARGDVKTLTDYQRWCGCADTPAERAWFKRINDDRNVQMAGRIAALHGAGQRLLVAVGALHMTGNEGLPKLLAAQGFAVQAVLPAK